MVKYITSGSVTLIGKPDDIKKKLEVNPKTKIPQILFTIYQHVFNSIYILSSNLNTPYPPPDLLHPMAEKIQIISGNAGQASPEKAETKTAATPAPAAQPAQPAPAQPTAAPQAAAPPAQAPAPAQPAATSAPAPEASPAPAATEQTTATQAAPTPSEASPAPAATPAQPAPAQPTQQPAEEKK